MNSADFDFVPTSDVARRGDFVAIVNSYGVGTYNGNGAIVTAVRLGVITNISRSGEIRGWRDFDADRVYKGSALADYQFLFVPAADYDIDALCAAYIARDEYAFNRGWRSQAEMNHLPARVARAMRDRKPPTPAAIIECRDFLLAHQVAEHGSVA
ncbi:hypothetical protein [Gordonia aichiensis]|uniref:hypothetical protein n=1 Tax=Gordonia aichiensis TaxID=36820 RepID=UPI0032632779